MRCISMRDRDIIHIIQEALVQNIRVYRVGPARVVSEV